MPEDKTEKDGNDMRVADVENKILELAKQGKAAKEIAARVGVSTSSIYKVMIKHGIERCGKQSVLEGHENEIRKLIAGGEYHASLARMFGISKRQMITFCKKRGIELSELSLQRRNKAARSPVNRISEDVIAQRIREQSKSFVYIGGWRGGQHPVRARCTVCRYERTISPITLREHPDKHEIKCLECKRIKRQAEKDALEKKKQRERARKAKEREERQRLREKEKKKREHMCPVCGKVTSRRKYCSERCSKYANNSLKEINRRAKIKGALVDKDITLQSLYKRDRGVCYICGMATLLDDYTVKDGTTICGDWYPSIDHVKPLARGGLHSWDNVRLAHRRCNYVKRDR